MFFHISGDLMTDENLKRNLVKFVSDYTTLLSRHLAAAQKEMEGAVEIVMDGLGNIAAETDQQKKNADTILVGDQVSNSEFVKADGAKVSSLEKEEIRKSSTSSNLNISSEVVPAGKNLKAYMASLGDLDGSLQDTIFKMIGKMSNDDVVRQRIEHIAFICKQLADELGDVCLNVETKLKKDQISKIEAQLLKRVESSYTMEAEKEIHKKVFNG